MTVSITGWGLCGFLWNPIKACRYKLFPRNGRHATICALQPLEVRVRNITQMFWIIRRWAWFYTSPVSVCRFGAAPVVHMCMTKMNHQAHLTKFPHLGWSAFWFWTASISSNRNNNFFKKRTGLQSFGVPFNIKPQRPPSKWSNHKHSHDVSLNCTCLDEPRYSERHILYLPACNSLYTVVWLWSSLIQMCPQALSSLSSLSRPFLLTQIKGTGGLASFSFENLTHSTSEPLSHSDLGAHPGRN